MPPWLGIGFREAWPKARGGGGWNLVVVAWRLGTCSVRVVQGCVGRVGEWGCGGLLCVWNDVLLRILTRIQNIKGSE